MRARTSIASLLLPAIVLGFSSTSSLAADTTPADAFAAANRLMLDVLVQLNQTLLSKKPYTCDAADDTCPDASITVVLATVPGDDGDETICVARPPAQMEFKNTSSKKQKTITWKLDISKLPAGSSAEFHPDRGIAVIDDDAKQIKPDNKRTDELTFKAKNTHDTLATAVYVPFIYWTDSGKNRQTCASGDPKIVNN